MLPSRPTYQKLLKFMEIWRSSDKNKNAQFFGHTMYIKLNYPTHCGSITCSCIVNKREYRDWDRVFQPLCMLVSTSCYSSSHDTVRVFWYCCCLLRWIVRVLQINLMQFILTVGPCNLQCEHTIGVRGLKHIFCPSHFSMHWRAQLWTRTRGQSNLTKCASRGAHFPVSGHPRGSKFVPLNSWGRGSYQCSIVTIGLGCTVWPQCTRVTTNQRPTTSRHSLSQ